MDNLDIKQLKVQTHIGVYEWEQRISQPLAIDISIPIDLSGMTEDDLNLVIDYESLCKKVTTFAESSSVRLIETFANHLADFVMQECKVPQVTVRVSKSHAVKNAADIQITVNRQAVIPTDDISLE